MHLNNLVVAIQKVGGKTLRETSIQTKSNLKENIREGVVYLPFDSEYEIFLKNSSFYRAVVSISIDGTDVLGEKKLIIAPFASITLERFILDGDLTKGKRFKFVSVNSPEVGNPESSLNGWVTIRCQWERPITSSMTSMSSGSTWQYVNNGYLPRPIFQYTTEPMFYYQEQFSTGNPPISSLLNGNVSNMSYSRGCSSVAMSYAAAINNEQKGATVEGSESKQYFSTTTIGELFDGVTVISFHLLAPQKDEPYTVKDTKKKYCHSCGLQLIGQAQYCSRCGEKQLYLV